MKKSLLFGLLAVLAAVFIFTACDNGSTTTEYEYITVPGPGTETMIHIDEWAANQTELEDYLDKAAYEGLVIGYTGNATLTGQAVTIPEGYTVYVLSTGDLETGGSAGLEVEGTLWVGSGGSLTVTGDPIEVAEGGIIHVVKGATVTIADATDIVNADAETALGTGQVLITEATLVYTATTDFTATTGITTALGYIGSGTLELPALNFTPTAIVALSIPAGKTVTVEASAADTATSLTIPASLNLTASGTLTNLASLTVNGTFDADTEALAAVTSLTVSGTLIAASGTLKTEGAVITVNAGGVATLDDVTKLLANSSVAGTLTVGDATAFDTDVTLGVAAGATVNGVTFPGATAISAIGSAELTIDNLNVPAAGEFLIPATYEITVTGTLNVEGTLAFTADSSVLVIQKEGVLSAGAAAVFSSKSTVEDGSGVDLGVTATGDTTTLTGFTSGNDVPVVLTTTSEGAGGNGSDYVIGNAKFAALRNATTEKDDVVITSTAAATDAAAGSIKASATSAIVIKGDA